MAAPGGRAAVGPLKVGDRMSDVGPWSYEVELAAELISASIARQFVGRHLGAHDLSYLVDDVRLVVSELAANVLVHARTPLVVSLVGDARSVLLTVRDGSAAFPVRAAADDLATSGRGLAIVDALSHDWGVVRGPGLEKAVWASFATRRRLDEQPSA